MWGGLAAGVRSLAAGWRTVDPGLPQDILNQAQQYTRKIQTTAINTTATYEAALYNYAISNLLAKGSTSR